jgi:O-antigen/teichoic acid export membrane protein
MWKHPTMIKKALKNKVLHYIFSRYATYFIQFVNSMFIAVYLGPFYLGIWGFITLIVQYINQINLGIAHSVNAIISVHKNKRWYVQKIIGNSLTMLLALSLITGLFFVANLKFNINIGDKYNFSAYVPAVALIGIIGFFNSLFSNIFRVYGKITEITINQSAFPILMLFAIFFFKGENLLWALVAANLLAFSLSLVIYVLRTPINLKFLFIGRLVKTIQIKGWHLFVYNSSFYLIMISTKTLISSYYTVEEFGFFTFAFSFANVVLLLLQSFSFLIFPKLINRMATSSNEKVIQILGFIRYAYITSSHFLIHLAILFFPLFILFFPQYQPSVQAFKLTALTIVLYTNSFGYSGLLIARNNERELGQLSLLALFVNIVCAFILIEVFNIPFSLVIISTMITYSLYVYLLGQKGRNKLNLSSSIANVFKDNFPVRIFIPYFLSLFLVIFELSSLYFVIPVIIFIILNFTIIKKIKSLIYQITINPNFLDI